MIKAPHSAFLATVFLFSIECFASTSSSLVPTKALFPDIQKRITAIEHLTETKNITYPALVPALSDGAQLYLSYETRHNILVINFDYSLNCHGAHYCNAGALSIGKKLKPSQATSIKVNLGHHITGFYAKPVTKADAWPPSIFWRCGDDNYELTWNIPSDDPQSLLIAMAKSTVKNSSCIQPEPLA